MSASERDREEALAHATDFANRLNAEGLRARVWSKPGVGVRVYIGEQFISVSRGGDLSLTHRGQASLVMEHLHLSQRSTLKGVMAEYRAARRAPHENPTMAEPKKAIRMFRRFHTRDWRGEGDFHRDFEIPDEVVELGPAVNILYGSDKLNPTTGEDEGWIEYIHEHDAGVHVYVPGGRLPSHLETARVRKVPAWIRDVDQLTWLGDCLGWAYKDADGRERKAEATRPLPELYTIPSGKALVVVQSKRRVLAIIWGGRLGVERRGIVH